MREELQKREGLRGRFTATFSRFGKKPGFDGRPPISTALFLDVRDERGDQVADHIWFIIGKGWRDLHLVNGDRVRFDARVTSYTKGYRGHGAFWEDDCHKPITKDYRLSRPTQLQKLNAPVDAPMPLFTKEAEL